MNVRVAMRRAMIDGDSALDAEKDALKVEFGADVHASDIYINLYDALNIFMSSLFLRQSGLVDELKRLLARGDVNGDSIFALKDFSQILHNLPCFNEEKLSDRKCLHIFKDALSYDGEGLNISRDTFVAICFQKQLVKLVDINEIEIKETEQEAKRALVSDMAEESKITATVLAQKESGAKIAVTDLAKCIEASKLSFDKAPNIMKAKLARLMKYLIILQDILNNDVPKVIPSFDPKQIAAEVEGMFQKGLTSPKYGGLMRKPSSMDLGGGPGGLTRAPTMRGGLDGSSALGRAPTTRNFDNAATNHVPVPAGASMRGSLIKHDGDHHRMNLRHQASSRGLKEGDSDSTPTPLLSTSPSVRNKLASNTDNPHLNDIVTQHTYATTRRSSVHRSSIISYVDDDDDDQVNSSVPSRRLPNLRDNSNTSMLRRAPSKANGLRQMQEGNGTE